MALQSTADLHLLNGFLPVSSVFSLSFQFAILHLLIYVCTQFHIPSCCPQLSFHNLFHCLGQFHSIWLFWGHNLDFLTVSCLWWQVFGLLPNPQPRGPVYHIYNPQGRVAQLYPRQRVTISVTFHNLHGLQWDYSFPKSPHRDSRARAHTHTHTYIYIYIYIYIRCVTRITWVTNVFRVQEETSFVSAQCALLYHWEFQHSSWIHAFSLTPFMWNIKFITFYCNPHACFQLQKFSKFGIQNDFFIFEAITCLTAVVTFHCYPTCYTMLHIYICMIISSIMVKQR